MITHNVFVFPVRTEYGEICDYSQQTAEALSIHNKVYVLLIGDLFSWKQWFDQWLREKKSRKIFFKDARVTYVCPFMLFPFRRIEWVYQLNLALFLAVFYGVLMCFHPLIFVRNGFYFWVFNPFQEFETTVMKKLGMKMIYDIIDHHTLPRKKENDALKRIEAELIRQSDLVIVNSATLAAYYSKIDTKVVQVPVGFRLKVFIDSQRKAYPLKITSPVIGFVGHINERLDLGLMEELVSKNPTWQFVFVGPVKHDQNISDDFPKDKIVSLFEYKNCHHIDRQPREMMKGIIEQFDICMIPYDVRYVFNQHCFPMKTLEYFYVGKPVISTPILEMEKLEGLVRVGKNAKEWQYHIRKILKEKWQFKKQQREFAVENSWKKKIEAISALLSA